MIASRPTSHPPAAPPRALGTLALVFIMYFNTSGGAYTTESLVMGVGPGLALLILVLVPLLYSLPEILIVGELASMLPVEGGYYRWVQRAFGPRWAFQNAWLTWAYSLVDMAIYPILFVQYLGYFLPGLDGWTKYAIALAVIWGATGLNLRGALDVGRASVIAGGFVVLGFLLLTVAALPNVTHAPWQPLSPAGSTAVGGLGVGLSIALWNYVGWDNASTVQGEVRDSGRTYPKALAIALPLVAAGYLLPLLATLGATDWTRWQEGGWPQIARMAAGSWGPVLAAWLAVGGMVSAIALFNALLLVYSRIPFVLAEDRLVPPIIGRLDARGTPRNAVLIAAVCYSVMVLVPFSGLVVADVLLYSMALALEMASLVALRRKEPELRGSFRLPMGATAIALLASLPMLVLFIVVGLSIQDGEFGLPALIGAAVVMLLGPIAYRVAARPRD